MGLLYLARLYWLQVQSPDLEAEARRNSLNQEIEHPLRGMIYDRNNKLLVKNKLVFDIKIIADEFKLQDTATFCKLLEMDLATFRQHVKNAQNGLQRFKPYVLAKHISQENFARIQDRISDFPGLVVEARGTREYQYPNLASVLGYVKEISPERLKTDSSKYYNQGDVIGKSGLEKSYENVLRGRRGTRFTMVDARGVNKGRFKDGSCDTLAQTGSDLVATIDIDLQAFGELLMTNKSGSIVAIEPNTGEILSMVTAPNYDPNILSHSNPTNNKKYVELLNNPEKPLFNRAVSATYPPGSTFKLVQALVGLQDGVIDSTHTRLSCSQELVKCHIHRTPLSLHGSIMHSCNPFYYKTFNKIIRQGKSEDPDEDARIGLKAWFKHAISFGFGQKICPDLHEEKKGRLPSVEYYDEKYKGRRQNWRLANIYSMSIGQGEVSATPLQLANLAAIMANRGHYITPHLIKTINNGQTPLNPANLVKHQTTVDPQYYEFVTKAMEDVVRVGTGHKAYLPDIRICGKTGTAQNPHGDDHSIFIAFAPRHNPKIAIAVFVENAGFGGVWAAPIASLMIERYIQGGTRAENAKMVEDIIKTNFITRKYAQLARNKIRRESARKERKRLSVPNASPDIIEIHNNVTAALDKKETLLSENITLAVASAAPVNFKKINDTANEIPLGASQSMPQNYKNREKQPSKPVRKRRNKLKQ